MRAGSQQLMLGIKDTDLSNPPVISIIDDDEFYRRGIASFVDSLGYSVATFASPEEFLSSGRLDETACLISDIQMPGIDGLQLHERLVAKGCRLPVIFVTAYPHATRRNQALATGVLGILDKPFSEEKLISLLEKAVASP